MTDFNTRRLGGAMALATTLVLMASAAQARVITASGGGLGELGPLTSTFYVNAIRGSCKNSDFYISHSDNCSGIFGAGFSLSEANSLASAQGWSLGAVTTHTATGVNGGNSGDGAFIYQYTNEYNGGRIYPGLQVEGNFVIALSGFWNDPTKASPVAWSAYYLFQDVLFGQPPGFIGPIAFSLDYAGIESVITPHPGGGPIGIVSYPATRQTNGLTVNQVSVIQYETPGNSNQVPEPDTLTLTLLSLAGLGWLGWRARRAKTQPRR